MNDIRALFFSFFLVHVVNFKVFSFFPYFLNVFTQDINHVEDAEMWRNLSSSVSNSLTCTSTHTETHSPAGFV